MSTTDSTTKPRPAKPDPNFPLYAHKSGRWAKKICGKTHFFGPWRDPDGALRRYLAERSDLENGRKPRQDEPGIVVANRTPTSCPAKPYPDFPLYAHKSGRWAKKIRGKTHFFGPWRDPNGAFRRYQMEKDDLEAGRQPRRAPAGLTDALTVQRMVGLFLDAKEINVQSGELEESTWKVYESFGERMIRVFGANTPVESLGPDDFQKLRKDLQTTHKSLTSINSDIGKIKAFFNWAGPGTNGQGYIDRLPRFGSGFKRPSKSALEREREEQGERIFSAEQIRALLSAARPTLKAMILLGVNCGYGNTDCAKLALGKLDLAQGWANFARTKNGIRRRNPLWPETVEALRMSLADRKPPRDPKYANRVFITKYGQPFRACALGFEFEKLAVKIGMSRETADFYDLRRTCASIGLQVNDDEAMRTILGHKRLSADMLGVYNRLQVSDDRLRAVTDHIHDWLFTGAAATSAQESGDGQPAAPSEPAA
jgi:integrase